MDNQTIEIAVGVYVMIMENIATDLNLANGSQGKIAGIVLHPDEPSHNDKAEVELEH